MTRLALLFLAACAGVSAPPAEAHLDVPSQLVVPSRGEALPAPIVRANVCTRAMGCCEAYVEAMTRALGGGVDVESACAGIAAVRDAPDAETEAVCGSVIAAFRQSLEQTGTPIPIECAHEGVPRGCCAAAPRAP